MHGSAFVADLALVLGVAALTAVLARALRQPTVLGYLLAGLVVGPYLAIPIFADPERVASLAEFGVVLVMFAIGLEFRISKLARVLPVSGFTAIVQIAFLGWCGESIGHALGWSAVESTFLGASIAISSTMIVSKVFEQVVVGRDVRNHVLGVLVVQDVVAILLIATMTAVAAGGGLGPRELASTLGRLAGVLLLLMVGGLLVLPRLLRVALRQRSDEILAIVAVGLPFSLALLAEKLGYSVALGAFLAGVLVAEARAAKPIGRVLQPLRDVFAAVFFVSIGMSVDPRAAYANLGAILLVSSVVITAQLASVTVAGGLSGLGLRRGLSAGLALGQVGEFAFIIAGIGISAGVVRPELQAILVGVAVLTAFTTPLLVGRSADIVRAVDRRLPLRVQHLLAANEGWFAKLREGTRQLAPERRALRALVIDAFALLFVLVLCTAWLPELVLWSASHFGITGLAARAGAVGIALAVIVPILSGIARNTLVLARLAGAEAGAKPGGAAASTTAGIAAHTARLSVVLGVLLAVGLPSLAILRPRMPGGWGILALATVVLGLGWLVLRNAGRLAADVRSGAGELADLLARRVRGDRVPDASDSTSTPTGSAAPGSALRHPGGGRVDGDLADNETAALFSGLHNASTAPLAPDTAGVGRTLRQLDLRARTGATALAVLRGEERLLLPSGSMALRAGDVIALVGSRDALSRAVALLAMPAEEDDEAADDSPAESARA